MTRNDGDKEFIWNNEIKPTQKIPTGFKKGHGDKAC